MLEALRPWIPTEPAAHGERPPASPLRRARIQVDFGTPPTVPDTNPDFTLRHAGVWRGSAPATFTLSGIHGSGGTIDLRDLEAILSLPSLGAARDLPDFLTVCVGLLSGGLDRAMVHGGGVVGPDGQVWILAGPSGSGKSTTVANLVRAGWDYLCDDRLFLRSGFPSNGPASVGRSAASEGPISLEGPASIHVEGWLRPFLLDPPSSHGNGGREAREPVDPASLGAGKARAGGKLGGVLYPQIGPSDRTSLVPMDAGASLRRLIRESPWILADTEGSAAGLALLARAAAAPAFELHLAADTRSDPELISRILGDVVSCRPRS